MKIIKSIDNLMDRFLQKFGWFGIIVLIIVLLMIIGICCITIYNSWQSDSKIASFKQAQMLFNKPYFLANDQKHEEAYQEFNRLASSDELKNYPELQAEATFRSALCKRLTGLMKHLTVTTIS